MKIIIHVYRTLLVECFHVVLTKVLMYLEVGYIGCRVLLDHGLSYTVEWQLVWNVRYNSSWCHLIPQMLCRTIQQSGLTLNQASKCCTYISADEQFPKLTKKWTFWPILRNRLAKRFINAYVSANMHLSKRQGIDAWLNSYHDCLKNVLQFLSISAHNLIWSNMVLQYTHHHSGFYSVEAFNPLDVPKSPQQ